MTRKGNILPMATTKTNQLRFAECRSMGHAWQHARKAVGVDDDHGWSVPFGGSFGMVGLPSTCTNCGTERMRWISRSGETIPRYRHPDGYSRHGEERLSPQEWRSQYVASIFDAFEKRAPAKTA